MSLNINWVTSSNTKKLMLTMLGAIATFEREMLLERQREGIAKAKEKGQYKGRKPSAMGKGNQVVKLIAEGKTKAAVAQELGIGIASVYWVIRSPNG
jgi:DNA invertase Pin-like site-specific DNA recombinase